MRFEIDPGFDVEEFLAQPLVARVATVGPTIRPVWYLWEDGRFWWLTGRWARLSELLREDPRAALVVDTCDLETGRVLQVIAAGKAEIVPFDADRARRKLVRYLGPDESSWEQRFTTGTFEDPSTRFARLAPQALRARDLSFTVRADASGI
ncbi:MAG TPA: pyridoxamine 5'-phosphate oxidase family protein [Gaiellaceae bacterium]|nr:pyridoxamine 5'-phosphate oxidase family protein [Gaiellaceae bacterium]